jgi:hypothetical protein
MDSTLALPRYEPPALAWPGELGQRQEIVWWIVFVGFAYALAVAYAWYCTHTGGHPDIDLSWKGFKITCRS